MKIKNTLLKAGLALGLALTSNMAAADFTLGKTMLLEHTRKGAHIPLAVCRRAESIRIEANRDVFLSQVVFKFQNGESKTFEYHRQLSGGEYTKWRPFHIPKRARCVTHIEVKGTSKNSTGGITVHGRR